MTEKEFYGPRPTAQWDSVPAPELARLRRIEAAVAIVLAAYDDIGDYPRLIEALRNLEEVMDDDD